MSDMIERVARAICASRGLDPDQVMAMNSAFDDGRPEASVASPAWMNHTAAARAAIEALLVPTIDMIRAGAPLIDLPNDWLQSGLLTGKQRTALAVFTAMLDDALQRHERGNADSGEARDNPAVTTRR